jgi:hypothetical protein
MDIVEQRFFANKHFAFLPATLLMSRERHAIALDLDDEPPQFEIIRAVLQ